MAGPAAVYGAEILLVGAAGAALKCFMPFKITAVKMGTTINPIKVPITRILPCDILKSTMAVSAVPIRVPILARSVVWTDSFVSSIFIWLNCVHISFFSA